MSENMAATSKEPPSKKWTERKPSLGVNFEHGENGAVVLYTDNKEIIIGLVPKGYAVNAAAASAVGLAWKSGKNQTLSVKRTKEVLDKVFTSMNSPVQVTPKTLDEIMGSLKSAGFIPEKV